MAVRPSTGRTIPSPCAVVAKTGVVDATDRDQQRQTDDPKDGLAHDVVVGRAGNVLFGRPAEHDDAAGHQANRGQQQRPVEAAHQCLLG